MISSLSLLLLLLLRVVLLLMAVCSLCSGSLGMKATAAAASAAFVGHNDWPMTKGRRGQQQQQQRWNLDLFFQKPTARDLCFPSLPYQYHQKQQQPSISFVATRKIRRSAVGIPLFWSFFSESSSDSSLSPDSSSSLSSSSSSTSKYTMFQQRPGESDMDFLRRLQKESIEDVDELEEDDNDQDNLQQGGGGGGGGGYQRAEDWDAEQRQSGSWEERVKFDGQRFGDQVKQNGILRRHLNGF